MADRDRDEKSGKFTEEYPLKAFIDVLKDIGPTGTTDVAERIGCDRRTAYLKLNKLEKDGKVKSKKIGNALLWELSEDTNDLSEESD